MSELKILSDSKKTSLQSVRLQGFRTIRDVEIGFEPGFNVIIGKNGTGKSNFLKFLHSSVTFSLSPVSQLNARLDYSQEGKKVLTIESEKKIEVEAGIENGTPEITTKPVTYKIIEEDSALRQLNHGEDVLEYMDSRGLNPAAVFISHGGYLPIT